MIVWQGLGILALVIPVCAYIVVALIAQSVLGVAESTRDAQWMAGIALLASGGLTHVLAKRLAARPVRRLMDPSTGEEFIFEERHTLFFVPVRFWAMIWATLGVFLAVLGFPSLG